MLSAIYEQDFLPCSFGGRPKLSAHHALATLNQAIGGKKVNWVYEADLKNFFGSLSHEWVLKFVEHRIGDPRIINLIKRWLKAGILDDGEIREPEEGTPQGGSVSVLLSNIYLHYVLDLWFEKVVKPRMRGETYLIRYIDDFIVCFQHQSDALRFQSALQKRLEKYSLTLEPNKTQLIEFGRFARQHAVAKEGKVKTLYFLGFTHYCSRTRKGNFMVGRKTEKARFRRSVAKLHSLLREIRHDAVKEQVKKINRVLQGHYAYYGLGGNAKSLYRLYNTALRYWHKMLGSRSWRSYVTWEKFLKLRKKYPIAEPKLKLPLTGMKVMARL